MRLTAIPPYSGAISFAVGGAGPFFEIQTGATDFLVITELICMILCDSASNNSICPVGLGIPAVKGIGVNGTTLAVENSGLTDALPGTTVYTQWNAPPTSPTSFFRRSVLNFGPSGTIAPIIQLQYYFPNGLKIGPLSSLVLFATGTLAGNIGATGMDINIICDN